MAYRPNGHAAGPSELDASEVETLRDLAGLLRALRRREARRRRDGELTYRELAERTGWSTAAVAEYLTGRTLPPTDRFDALVRLLGAAPIEQGALATARDRVAERQRAHPRRAGGPPVPRQLPADVHAFTGRDDELAHLDALLARGRRAASTAVVISAVSGTAGVGKTALAVHWAHRAADHFPDGQLYINLRGYDPERPVEPGDALARLLTALGVAESDLPGDVDDRAARYRTQLAGRRMVIVLDNAATVEQVRPLLPGTPSCVAVVTSRDSLAGLVARDGARRVDLDLLPIADAAGLLAQLIGPRAGAEPEAVTALAARCARLPLALRVAAELATARPAASLADLAAELADRQRRLALMDAGGDPRAAVTTVFSWSVRHLPAAVARTFRLLSLHPGADLDGYAVAALTGGDPASAGRDLDVLARAHLVDPGGPGRYGMHDLLRAYAAELADRHESDDDLRAARGRLFDAYLATAAVAMDLLDPVDVARRPRPPAPASAVPALADARAASSWLDAERSNLVEVAACGAANGWPGHAVALSITLFRYLVGGHYTDAMSVHADAERAAGLTGDKAGQAHALLGLGITHLQLCRYEPAVDHIQRALPLFQQADDHSGQARALSGLGNVERRLGRFAAAADYLEQAQVLFRRAGDHTGQVHALINLGGVELNRGRFAAAADRFQRALAGARGAGDRSAEAVALSDLGEAEHRLNRHEAAVEHLGQALVAFRHLGDRQGEGDCLDSLGAVHLGLERPERAAECFAAALSIFAEIGDREGRAWALNGLGEAALATARPADALNHHADALATADDIGSIDQRIRAHTGLGRAHHALGDHDPARHHLREALAGHGDARSPEADQTRSLLAALPPPPPPNA